MSDEQTIPKSAEELHQENLAKDKERIERMERVRKETIERLKTDPAILSYFEKFNKYSIESFITSYSHLKNMYMEYGDMYNKMGENYNTAYFGAAKTCLSLIQIKKLFDMRCRWGAYKADLPEIETSWDFLYWSYNVMNCPFLTPVSNEELELFLQFARTHDFNPDEAEILGWFFFDTHRSGTTDDECSLPEWFYFHNTHTNASQYFALPDLRGDKEMFYRKLSTEKREQEHQQKIESGEIPRPQPVDKRPMINSHSFEQVEEFVKEFEDDAARKKFYAYATYGSPSLSKEDDDDESDYLNEQVEEIIEKLASIRHVIPVEANADIRVAIVDAWKTYEKEQIILCLRPAYEDYLFRVQNKISFPIGSLAENSKDLAKNVKEQVLRGRELNGEPADLNF